MHKIIGWILVLLLLGNPLAVQAAVLEDDPLSYKNYLFALVCRAAYSDRTAQLVTSALVNDGWEIEHYSQSGDVADARFFFAKKQEFEGRDITYILAVYGTENIKDIKVDLDFGKVYFSGNTIEEIQKNAMIKPIPAEAAAVHRGFFGYVNTAAKVRDGKRLLLDMLLEDSRRKVYMVGHSLGGAVVTLAAAYLINMGVRPEQIEVVTFGAPAVGNDVFAEKIGAKINLTRIVNHGDPVPSVLKDLVGGYQQFGKNVDWILPDHVNRSPHEMVTYLDIAMRRYYKEMGLAQDRDLVPMSKGKKTIVDNQRFYVAPIANRLPKGLDGDLWYMKMQLAERYRSYISANYGDVKVSDDEESLTTTLQKASLVGCKWVLSGEIQGYKVKNEEDLYYLTVYQTIYRVSDGQPVAVFTFGTNTKNITPLEAVAYESIQTSDYVSKWMSTDAAK